MQVLPVDPRGTHIEIDSPTYRVYFWEQQVTQEGATPGFKSFEHEVTDARDVHEVLRWAEANAGDRTFTVTSLRARRSSASRGRTPPPPDNRFYRSVFSSPRRCFFSSSS